MNEELTFAARVAQRLIEQLEQGTAPWQKPWNPGVDSLPMNPTTGKRYRGINALWLLAQGYDDPRWCTYRQALAQGWQVKCGAKATSIEYWQFEEERRNDQGEKERVRLAHPRVFWASVFHASQIQNIPSMLPLAHAWDANERAETILRESGARIEHEYGNRALYSPTLDAIRLPERSQFPDAARYYATALHELGHWTGHSSRLGRDLSGAFGCESYAREELRAEIAGFMLGMEIGVGHDPGQHAAYVQSWIKALKDDPREIFRASADAEKIYFFVKQFDKYLERVQDPVKEMGRAIAEVPDKIKEVGKVLEATLELAP